MRRIAEQGDPSRNPRHDRVAVVHPPPLVAPHVRDSLTYLRTGIGECGVEFIRSSPVLFACNRFRRLEDGNLIEHLAAAQAVVHEVMPRSDIDHDLGQVDWAISQLRHRHRAAVRDVGGRYRFVVDQQLTGYRVQAVGRDDDPATCTSPFERRTCAPASELS